MKIFKDAHTLNGFKDMLNNFEQKRPSLFIVKLNQISPILIMLYKEKFHWHWNDTVRNFTKLESSVNDAITYYNRMNEHFGYDQAERYLKNMNNCICFWDPKRDMFSIRKPCMITMKMIVDNKILDMVVTWRNRDVLRRMIGNWIMLKRFGQEICDKKKWKLGTLYDFNMQAFYQKDDLKKWRKQL